MSEQPVLYQRKPKPRASSGRGWLFWILVVGVPVVVVLYLGLVVGFGYFYVTKTRQLPVSESEWAAVVDAHDVAQWMSDLEVSTKEESIEKIRYVDGSHEINYEYNPAEGSIYLSSSLSVERKLTDAITGYLPLWTATKAGLKLSGDGELALEVLEDFFQWGDQSKVGLIRRNGEPYGHVFVARDGVKVVFLLLSGVYFEEPQMWAEFLNPTLDHISIYSPRW